MSKVIFSASIPILIILIAYFAYMNFTYVPPKNDQDIEAITRTILSNSEETPGKTSFQRPSRAQLPTSIWTNNIFNSDRSTASASGTVTSLKDMTLVGVFGDETQAGAVFLTGAQSPQFGGPSSSQGIRGYNPGAPLTQAQIQAAQPPRPKMVFLVGEKLPNGYILKSVSKDSATLQGADGDVTLQLDFTDEARTKRILESQKSNTNLQVRIIETQKQGGAAPGGSKSGSSVVIRNSPEQNQKQNY